MDRYRTIAENTESTVVARYECKAHERTRYQSEADLEERLIEQLQEQGYTYLPIHSEEELLQNLRSQLERLNAYCFTDNEWVELQRGLLSSNMGIVEKTRIVQENSVCTLRCDDGEMRNIMVLDRKNIHANRLQVLNQYVPTGGKYENRYDVTILVNGLPLVHIELKRRGVALKEAFNQINRYQRDSFWAGCGLFEYVQLFVISNGTETKYYSNTTRNAHVARMRTARGKGRQTSHSFEFTSYWADRENNIISDMEDFTATFFSRHTLLSVLLRYCIFTSEELLLVMRPYQISATEAILQRIVQAVNRKKEGTREAGGYIWHTTGSGKTLTSFKTARIASRLPEVDKVLFVVDRKDLDYQTMREYDRFEKGAANGNASTHVLQRQLEDEDTKIIITTIQKLSIFVRKNPQHGVYDKRVVMIFDECHRSQFGDMHTAIVKRFKRYFLFGFTGTPIFAKNAGGHLQTTEQRFGDCLHIYTVINAIADGNVLPFRVEYVKTIEAKNDIEDLRVKDIEREQALCAPERIGLITKYILEHFDQKTKRNQCYQLKERRVNGFNSIFATASIPVARLYYDAFQQQMSMLPPARRLRIATIFSYAANEDTETDTGFLEEENSDSTAELDVSSRDFLARAINDYNALFGTNYDTSGESFAAYYKDVSQRMKTREIDLLIVVNMFLTGFDATTLNTLWVDKNLRMHGLLQAYSRTNRILNSVKTYGNIVCFRNLEEETNESIALFGDRDARGMVLLRTFDEYYYGYDAEQKDGTTKHYAGYKELVEQLQAEFPKAERIVGEEAEQDFIRLFGMLLRSKNILTSFDRFEEKRLLSVGDEQDYQSIYLDLRDKYRPQSEGDVVNVNDDLSFEIELVKQVEINIDYILLLVQRYHDNNCTDKEIILKVRKSVMSSPDLRNKKDLIEDFVSSLTPDTDVQASWTDYVHEQQIRQLDAIIEQENLKQEATYRLMRRAFRDGELQDGGTDVVAVLPPMSLFAPDNARAEKKRTVLLRLHDFFNRFFDIARTDF